VHLKGSITNKKQMQGLLDFEELTISFIGKLLNAGEGRLIRTLDFG
jgi:hypothetical protein